MIPALLEKLFGPSWKTTLSGLIGLLTVIAYQVWNHYDGDPNTKFDFSVIIAAISTALVAGSARDKKISDQESGIPPERTSPDAFASYERKHGPAIS